MLNNVFQTVIQMNITALIIAAVILPVKFIIQKIGFSRRILFVLWAVIAFRLISPFAPAADISIFNLNSAPEKTEILQYKYYVIPTIAETEINTYNDAKYETESGHLGIIPIIWFYGTVAMIVSGGISYIRLKRNLRFAVKLKDNVYMSDKIHTSFVFGFLKPKIFIPENIGEEDLNNIIIHEQAHIKRFDHITKIFAYLILSVHWFNPFNWLLFKLFSEDTELLCDEKALDKIGDNNKNSYVNTLLKFSINRKRTMVFYNVGFSLHTTKRRIKHMLNMKKSSKTMTAVTVCMCLFILCATATNAVVDDISITLPPLPVPESIKEESVYVPEPPTQEDTVNTDIPDAEGTTLNEITAENTFVHIPEVPHDEIAVSEILEPITQHPDTEKVADIITDEVSVKIKSNEISDLSYIGMEQIEFPAGANIPDIILNELKKRGITESGSGAANLTKNYLKDDYNTKDNYYEKINGVLCDENGNISFYMELNSGNFMDVTITDSETGKQVIGFGMLAGGKSAYTLLGFDKNKSYNIEIKSVTDDEWNLEGQYIIY